MKKGDNLLSYIAFFLALVSIIPLATASSYKKLSAPHILDGERVLLELKNFSYKELSQNEEKMYVTGERGLRFEDRDEISGFRIYKEEPGYKSVVSSKKAVRANGESLLTEGVEYNRSDGYRLTTQKTKYIEKSKTLLINSPFIFEGRKFRASGESSEVDIQNKKVAINSVRAKIYY